MALEILKPTDYTFSGGGTNDNPGNAYDVDVSSYNRLGVSNNNTDPTIVYHTWQSVQHEHKTRQLFVKRRGIGNSDDTWAIYYSTDGGNNWTPIETGLINPELGSTTAVSIDIGLDLANLQVKIATFKKAAPDNGYADIYDIWLEGLHYSWVSPTGHDDPSSDWDWEEDGYNDDTGDFCYNTDPTNPDYFYLTLVAGITCNKVRAWSEANSDWDIDVHYGGGWHNIHSGSFAENQWVEFAIGSEEIVDQARIRETEFYALGKLNDFDFWEVEEEPPPTYIPKVIMVQG